MSGLTKVGTGAKLEDSNIALYGSKDHKDAKLNAAKTEEAWKGCGAKVGVEVWRIEKFKVVHWPNESYGSFYDGDSYIVLNTYSNPENKDKLLYNVHFWLGSKTSQDEMGTAAYKTVELDDLLGDLPVQYREVQGSESDAFLAVFGGKISIMCGGIDSGFKKVKPEDYKPRLMHMKGKKTIRVTEVPLAVASLNDGDVFLLDAGLILYQWNGKSAGIYEKRKAAETVEALKKERNSKPKSVIIDSVEKNPDFWKILGTDGSPPAKVADATSDDIKVEKRRILIEVSDKTGSLVQTKVAEGAACKKSLLKTDEVFIYDVGEFIYCWIGKGASKEERSNGITIATTYLKTSGLPASTPLSRVMEGNEPKAFKDYF